MDIKSIQKVVVQVITDIQNSIGGTCPSLTGSDVPSKVIIEFDSTVWPLATTRIAKALGITIPSDVHIFGGERGRPLMTIKETSKMVLRKHITIPSAVKKVA